MIVRMRVCSVKKIIMHSFCKNPNPLLNMFWSIFLKHYIMLLYWLYWLFWSRKTPQTCKSENWLGIGRPSGGGRGDSRF